MCTHGVWSGTQRGASLPLTSAKPQNWEACLLLQGRTKRSPASSPDVRAWASLVFASDGPRGRVGPSGRGRLHGQNWEGGGRSPARAPSTCLLACCPLHSPRVLSFCSWKQLESCYPGRQKKAYSLIKITLDFTRPCFLCVRFVSFPAQLQWTVASVFWGSPTLSC